MRLNINLATRPYRDVRQFLRTWGTGTALLALLTIGLCWYTFYAWHQSRNARSQVSEIQSEIDKLDRQREAGIALLNQPPNRDVANQSAFLNGLIARRSFSWTLLFMELERIMPARLHVTSIAPSLNKRNQIEVHMVVAGDSRDQALELVRRLEDSPSFRQAELRSESLATNTPGAPNSPGGDRVQFDISLVYVPQTKPEQTTNKGPEQTAENEKAINPSTGKKDDAKALNPSIGKGKKGDYKALGTSIGKKGDDRKGRPAQAVPANSANASAAAGGKGVAR